jgi:hypothetical protein
MLFYYEITLRPRHPKTRSQFLFPTFSEDKIDILIYNYFATALTKFTTRITEVDKWTCSSQVVESINLSFNIHKVSLYHGGLSFEPLSHTKVLE